MRNKHSADAAITAAVVGLAWVVFVIGIVLLAGAVLVPYTVETWAAWLGHTVVIQWWKGIIIGVIGGIITRTGIVYIAITCALITWLMQLCGFTGF